MLKMCTKWKQILLIFLLIFTCEIASAQTLKGYSWWNPATNKFQVIEGTAGNSNKYETGTYLKFNSNAADIVIRYIVQNDTHNLFTVMPLTGSAGLDLYALDHNGKWIWVPAHFSFGDTIVYHFSHLEIDKAYRGKEVECRLFLPISQTVRWMEIGVPDGSTFTPQPLQPEKPIVVYSNLITSTTSVSSPGLVWTALLERKLDRPIIHFDISIKRMLNRDAALYVLDWCSDANLKLADDMFRSSLSKIIHTLQTAHPGVPVLLMQHSTGNMIDTVQRNEMHRVNDLLKQVFTELKTAGIKNLYQLTDTDISLNMHATTDGLSLNDTGMQQYAAACEKTIRLILQQSIGEISTTIPVVQSRDGLYNWRKRHAEVLASNKSKAPINVIMANSIIHYWGGEPKGPFSRGEDSWNQWLEPLRVRNMGFGWDKIENVLWRIYHDELDGFTARHVVLMIGTNNLSGNSDEEIIAGLKLLVQAVAQRQPSAKILLSGLLPRRNMEARVEQLNRAIEQLATQTGAVFINTGKLLLNDKGKVEESLFGDGLHPNAAGYQKIAPALSAFLKD
ncbi:MAG: lipolytic protein family [Mucilaginibacter sp.]|nr:lipolytic protein family [Mucilaginibacter sp.]